MEDFPKELGGLWVDEDRRVVYIIKTKPFFFKTAFIFNLLEQLKQISVDFDVGDIYQRFRLCQVLLFKTSTRIRDRGKAEELLVELVEDVTTYSIITKIALINLSELLLSELRSTGNSSILSEINSYVTILLKIAESKNSYLLYAEIYWLQAQMALLDLNTKKAKDLLLQAHKITEERGLILLRQEIENEQRKLDEQFGL